MLLAKFKDLEDYFKSHPIRVIAPLSRRNLNFCGSNEERQVNPSIDDSVQVPAALNI
jgi:hypothetical protein